MYVAIIHSSFNHRSNKVMGRKAIIAVDIKVDVVSIKVTDSISIPTKNTYNENNFVHIMFFQHFALNGYFYECCSFVSTLQLQH